MFQVKLEPGLLVVLGLCYWGDMSREGFGQWPMVLVLMVLVNKRGLTLGKEFGGGSLLQAYKEQLETTFYFGFYCLPKKKY